MAQDISRRRFIQFGGLAALSIALPMGGIAGLTGCRSEAGDAVFRGERTITDDAGREHTIPMPDKLTRVYFTSGLAQLFVMTLKPEAIGATCSRFSEEDMKYLPNMKGLEYLGAVETGQMDVEAVMQAGIQLIFSIS